MAASSQTAKQKRIFYALLLAAGIITADLWTKAWILSKYSNGELPEQVNGFFNLVLVLNSGVSFGFLRELGQYNAYILSLLAGAITLFLFIWLIREKAPSLFIHLALGSAIGGAIGNIIDRVRFGAVVDFVDLHAFGYHWPAFNVADSAISIAMIALIILIFFKKN
ncbi:MAG: signal peptidase II [Alphaproteobacteria bacterium]